MYYCRINENRGGFFDAQEHGEIGSPGCTIPPGALEVSDEDYAELMVAAAEGKLIVPGPDGHPMVIELLPPTPGELAAIERAWRDSQLMLTDPLVSRHRDELEEGVATTLSAEQYTALQTWRRALRDWPQGGKFPLIEHRPLVPELLTGLVL